MNKIKQVGFIRNNYRRMRKIFLHLIHGRFFSAFKIANHYNPVYRLVARNSLYIQRRQRRKLSVLLKNIYSYPSENRKGFQVALVFRDGKYSLTSSAFIRLISPLTDKSIKNEVSIDIISAQDIPNRIEVDFVIVQRTAFDDLSQAKSFLEKVQSQKSKMIIDNDDAFHKINNVHPEYNEQTQRVEAIEYLMMKADQIWVSTSQLIERRYSAKTKVVANSLDARLWQNVKSSFSATGPIEMVYMGTATHKADLEIVLPALDKLYERYPGSFRLTVVGVSPDVPKRKWIRQLIVPRYGSVYPVFVRWFLKRGPFDIGLSPLLDSSFNKSKSDIKCLDYLAAGITPVVSDVLPYRSKEIQDFIIKIKNNEKDWTDQLSEIVSDPETFRKSRSKIISKAQKYIWQNRSSTKTASTLINHLKVLANSK